MAQLHFPINLSRKIECPDVELDAKTVGNLFEHYFSQQPKVRSYVLDDQGVVRKYIVILIDGFNIQNRKFFTDLYFGVC
jgi:hypothetical protein